MQITRKHLIGTLAATSLIAGAAVPVVAQSDNSRSAKSFGSPLHRGSDTLSVRGLTADSRLIAFNERTPALARTLGRISGLAGDTKLIGIDYRPATGDLYGVGEQGGVYALDSRARATKRAQLTVALGGTSFETSTRPSTGCGSSARPVRACAPTSAPARRRPTRRSAIRRRPLPPRV